MFVTYDANQAWLTLLTNIMQNGRKVVPRGKETKEVLGSLIRMDMRRPVLSINERKLGYRFMCAEAAWIMSGDDRVETISPYSKVIGSFSDDGLTYFGAYGPKLLGQLDYVVASLQKDRETRQAVANIWRENPPATKDYPCTLSVQFMIRKNYLHAFITMRSNDIWLGFPYDVFNASMWAGYILRRLDDPTLKLGCLYHSAASRHLYATNFEEARAILNKTPSSFSYEPFNPSEFGTAYDLNAHLWALAKKEPITHGWLKELNER
jgi:thymidylate synthase